MVVIGGGGHAWPFTVSNRTAAVATPEQREKLIKQFNPLWVLSNGEQVRGVGD